MKNKMLVVEDDLLINDMIKDYMTKNGYDCTQAFSGTEAMLQMQISEFDIIILDFMLPGMNGCELIKKIRPRFSTPIIIVSARDDLESKVTLLSCGADDYLTKPFELEELLVRVSVQIRRCSGNAESDTITYKKLLLNRNDFSLHYEKCAIPLTKLEFKIVELFLTYPKKVFSKQDIYDYAWDDYYIGDDKTINVHISNIRQKLKKYSDDEYIETVWGVGFKLSE